MNTTQIRIKPETKIEIDRLILLKIQKEGVLRVNHSEFIDELVLAYKELKKC